MYPIGKEFKVVRYSINSIILRKRSDFKSLKWYHSIKISVGYLLNPDILNS